MKIVFPIILLFACSELHRQKQIDQFYKNSTKLRETVAFMAGLDLPQNSSLQPLTRGEQYKKYKADIDKLWQNYNRVNLQKMASWQKKNVPSAISKKLYYPFSGPDLLNALTFFPDSDEIIMMALEPPGEVPYPENMNRNIVSADLQVVKKALQHILRLNFFVTDEMRVNMKHKSLSSISGIMMFFIVRCGYEILDFTKVIIDEEGNVVPLRGNKKAAARGITILFRKPGSYEVKTARYFNINLSDNSLRNSPLVMKYLNKNNNFTTFIKSASYLLHNNSFSVLRKYILAKSDLVLQEDCGVPLKYFSPSEWKLKFYGNYRIHPLFPEKKQPDFAQAIKKNSLGTLPFYYGYGFSREYSNIMIAQKISNKN